MPLIRTPALVLHAFAYGDTSKILRLLTHDHGVRSVIAKGAQRPRSRFGGVLEPFTEGEAQFNLREGRDLFTLSGFTLLRSRQAIGRDLGAFTGASLLAELLLRYGTDEPDPALYQLVRGAFDRLAESPPHSDSPVASLAVLWSVIAHLGFRPEIDACVRCGRVLEERENARFDAAGGGVACTMCGAGGRAISGAHRLDLGRMCRGVPPAGSLQDRRLHGDLMHAFLSAHLLHGRPLRSLQLFMEQLR